MKKTVLSLAFVTAAGIAGRYSLQPSGAPADIPKEQPAVPPPPKAAPAPSRKDKQSVQERMQRDLQKLDESMARTRQSSTPEIRAAIRKRMMEKGRDDYEEFFSTLELDEGTTRQAVDVMLERDLKILDANEQLQETGFIKGGKQFGETLRIEKALAESQLQSLLGTQDYEKLIAFEKDRQAQMMARAQKVISKMND